VASINVGIGDVEEASSQLDVRQVDLGSLRYGNESFYSGVYFRPPRIARVAWREGKQRHDRTVAVIGKIPYSDSKIDLPQLVIEIDSDCDRVRVSWISNRMDVFSVAPNKYQRRDCTIYTDIETPADAPSWPANY
jgi:hypothetical protein